MNVWQRFHEWCDRNGVAVCTERYAELYRRVMRSPASYTWRARPMATKGKRRKRVK